MHSDDCEVLPCINKKSQNVGVVVHVFKDDMDVTKVSCLDMLLIRPSAVCL